MADEAQRSLWSIIYRQLPSDYSIMNLVEDYSVRFVVRFVGAAEREPRLRGEIRVGSGSNWQPFYSSCVLRSRIPWTTWGKCSIHCHFSYSGSVSRFSVSIVFCSVSRFASGSLGCSEAQFWLPHFFVECHRHCLHHEETWEAFSLRGKTWQQQMTLCSPSVHSFAHHHQPHFFPWGSSCK